MRGKPEARLVPTHPYHSWGLVSVVGSCLKKHPTYRRRLGGGRWTLVGPCDIPTRRRTQCGDPVLPPSIARSAPHHCFRKTTQELAIPAMQGARIVNLQYGRAVSTHCAWWHVRSQDLPRRSLCSQGDLKLGNAGKGALKDRLRQGRGCKCRPQTPPL